MRDFVIMTDSCCDLTAQMADEVLWSKSQTNRDISSCERYSAIIGSPKAEPEKPRFM